MRIAFCTPGSTDHADYLAGDLLGSEAQIFGLATQFTKLGNEVFIIRRWYDQTEVNIINGINIINVSSFDLPDHNFQKIATKSLFSRQAHRVIETIKPDILILTDLASALFTANCNVPKIYVTHNAPSIIYPAKSALQDLIKKRLERDIFQKCDYLIALNEEIKKSLADRYNVELIPNAIDIDKYPYSDVDEEFILFGGRFVKIKGLDNLIKAYARIDRNLRDRYKLVLVGEGPEEENLKFLVKELGISDDVIFHKWLNNHDFIEKLSKCSVFVLPSLSETFGIVVLEAMALGKPVIANDISGPKDIIIPEYNGYLCHDRCNDSLQNYLDLLLANPQIRDEIGKNARDTVINRFSFEQIGNMYIDLFQRLLFNQGLVYA
jgi:glycosyltransferase involved in cell wall biosynthesis